MRFETIAIHTGERPDAAYGAVSVPLYLSSTFAFADIVQPVVVQPEDEIEHGIAWVRDRGVRVDPVSGDLVEG